METLRSFSLALFMPVLELALSFSVISADFTAKVLRVTTPQEVWRYRAAGILANRNVARTGDSGRCRSVFRGMPITRSGLMAIMIPG
jgi:hypothetical protein